MEVNRETISGLDPFSQDCCAVSSANEPLCLVFQGPRVEGRVISF